MEEENKDYLKIIIEYKSSISLLEFKNHLEGWHNQYNRHLANNNISDNEDTLLIKEIKEGSIEISLIPAALFIYSNMNNIVSFYDYIKRVFNWLITLKGSKPVFTKEDLVDFIKIITPAIKKDNRITINVNGDNNEFTFINNESARAIKENANSEQLALSFKDNLDQIPDETNIDNVILKFTQTEGTDKNNRNTKGVISTLDKKSYPITFAEGLKQKLILGLENPHLTYNLVNVKVHRENGVIKSYTVLNVIDSYFDENTEQQNTLFSEGDENH